MGVSLPCQLRFEPYLQHLTDIVQVTIVICPLLALMVRRKAIPFLGP